MIHRWVLFGGNTGVAVGMFNVVCAAKRHVVRYERGGRGQRRDWHVKVTILRSCEEEIVMTGGEEGEKLNPTWAMGIEVKLMTKRRGCGEQAVRKG